jgi:hypothetical protein
VAKTYAAGTVVRYSRPVDDAEASLRFQVVEDRDDRILIVSLDFPEYRFPPQEVVEKSAIDPVCEGGAVMANLMIAPARCPECGGVLQVERQCRIERPMMVPFDQRRDAPAPRKVFIGAAALCTGCEYAIEIVVSERSQRGRA